MELEELKNIWNQQKRSPDMEYSQSELLMLLNNKMISFEKDVRSRDRLELVACVIVMAAFIFYFFMSSSIWIKIGSVVIVFSCLLITYRLKMAQPPRTDKQLSYDHSISHHLKLELKNVQTQKELLTNIVWWYIGPMGTGLIIFSFGFPLTHQLIYIAVIITVGIGIWYLNQKAVAERMDPLIANIQEALDFLQSKQR